MGHTPTLMDYSRFNYVAQPEDGIDPADLVPGIGPYDAGRRCGATSRFRMRTTPDDEKPTLDQWARAQDTTPWLRFSTVDAAGSDPGELTEAVGDADAVRSTTMGLEESRARRRHAARPRRRGPASRTTISKRSTAACSVSGCVEMNHVAAVVGGFDTRQKVFGQDGLRFVPIPRARQQEAMRFLNTHAFATPAFVIRPEILRRIEPAGALDRIRTSQQACWRRCSPTPASRGWWSRKHSTARPRIGRPSSSRMSAAAIWGELSATSVRSIRTAATFSARIST